MEGKETRIDNEKYRREKRRKEAIAAWGFLLPNFLGFMIITFFPIFATFVLAFTEWDGKSAASPAILRMKFVTEETIDESIVLPEDAVVVYEQLENDVRQRGVTVPFKLNHDIVIPAGDVPAYGFLDINAFKEWNSYTDDTGETVISPVSSDELPALVEQYDISLEPDEYEYIREKEMLFDQDNILSVNPRLADSVDGVSKELSINLENEGAEVTFFATDNEDDSVTIPAGTVIFVDLLIQKVLGVETNYYHFPLDKEYLSGGLVDLRKPIEIKTSTGESMDIAFVAEETGEVSSIIDLIGYLVNAKNKMALAEEGTTEYEAALKNYNNYVTYMNTMLSLTGTGIPDGIKIVAVNNVEEGNNGIKFVGFKNFKTIFLNDSRFWDYMINTLVFLLEIPICMAASLIMAIAMNQPLKGIVVFRVLYFLPNISNIVAVALLWRWILNADYGFLNNFLRAIGINNPPQWFSNKGWAKVAIIIVDVWKSAGYNMMLYLAGLQGIPHFLYEAADIDGASSFQQFWKITWPLLGPTHFFILIMGVIGGFQAFGTQFVMTAGGPAGGTTTIVYYIYNHAYKWEHMGYATTIAVILFAFVMIITAINWIFSEGSVEY